jgi:cyclophilin family peptidyl-prolyl cis-trans isomerase
MSGVHFQGFLQVLHFVLWFHILCYTDKGDIRMKNVVLMLVFLSFVFGCPKKQDKGGKVEDTQEKEKVAVIETNLGKMVFRFFFKDAPKTCANFIKLADSGFYNGRQFYRVVKGHVIQGGCEGEGVNYTIEAEFNKNKHIVGTVGMARTTDPNSANTEFYICLTPRPHLDGKFTVFGQLIEGYDVLEKIGNVEIEEKIVEGIAFHRPKNPVTILRLFIEERVIKK